MNWITASTNQSFNHKVQIIVRNLKNMGYNLEIQNDQPDKLPESEAYKTIKEI